MMKQKALMFLSLMYRHNKNNSYLPRLSGRSQGYDSALNCHAIVRWGHFCYHWVKGTETKKWSLETTNGPRSSLFCVCWLCSTELKRDEFTAAAANLLEPRRAIAVHCCPMASTLFLPMPSPPRKTCARSSWPVRVHCFLQARWKSNLLPEYFLFFFF